jgi:hypothetical protein
MSAKRTDRRKIRRQQSDERLEAWRELTLKEQLDALDGRLGKGLGAKKQRARIQAKLEAIKERRSR